MSERIAIFGRTLQGKTYHIRYNIIPDLNRVIVFDIIGEYDELIIVDSIYHLACYTETNPWFKISYRPFSRRAEGDLDLLSELIFNTLPNTYLIIEEAENFFGAGFTYQSIQDIIRQGRHKGLSIIVTSKRPADISRLFTSQMSKVISFQITEPRDLDYLAKYGLPEDILVNLKIGQFTEKEI